MQTTNIKVVVSGSTIETYQYHDKSLAYDYKVPEQHRKKSSITVTDEESEQRKIESRKSSMLRAKFKLLRLINANAWRWFKRNGSIYPPIFLTLTFKEEIRIIKEANAVYSLFVKRLNYYLTGEKKAFLAYTVVIEFQDLSRDGVVHYHVIFFNLPWIKKDTLAKIWGQGFIKIKKITTADNAGAYVSKYMAKHFEDNRLDGQKRYFSTRGLFKPIEIRNEAVARLILEKLPKELVIYQKDFTTEKRGRITYTNYKLKNKQTVFDVIPELKKLL